MRLEEWNDAVAQYGTPLYIFEEEKALDVVRQFRTWMSPDVHLCFAMKANPFLTRMMADVVDRIEVCSAGEFQICRELAISPPKILLSGVWKERWQLETILNTYRGQCVYTAESLTQYSYLAQWSSQNQETISVYLRLTSGNQFGMDKETVEKLIELRQDNPYLQIQGIHYFSGTQKKAKKIKEELHALDDFLVELEEKWNFKVHTLEYGTGLSVPYFEGQRDTRKEDMEEILNAIRAMRWKGDVTLEMGRALTADCGYYLTSVQDVKQNNQKNYAIVDGGIHQMNYDGQIRGMYRPKIQVIPERTQGNVAEWTICGALCTGNDVLVQKIPIQRLQIGDVLVFKQAGAYSMTEGMALFLSHPLPQVVCYSQTNGWRMVRKKQPTYLWNTENNATVSCEETHGGE